MNHESTAQRRHWADLAVIVASAISVGLAIWGYLPSTNSQGETQSSGYTALASILAAACGVLGLALAQRSPGAGRIPVAAGGVILLVTPFLFSRPEPLIWTALVVLGVLLLVASPFVGRMPADLPSHRDAR